MPLAAGTRIGSYHVTAKIGDGGMGEVYRARDTECHGRKLCPSFKTDPDQGKHLQRPTNTVWRHQCSHAHSIRMGPPL